MHANESSCCLWNETSSNGPISYEASALEWFSQLILDDDDFEDSDSDTDTEDDELEPSTIYAKLSAASARVEDKLMSKHIKLGRIKDEHASTDVTSSFHRYKFQNTTTNDTDLGLRRGTDAATFAAAIATAQRSIPPPNNTPTHNHGHRHRRANSCPTVELGEMFNSTQITEELHILAPKTRTLEVATEILTARENKAAAA